MPHITNLLSSLHGVVLVKVHRLKQICMTIQRDSISCLLFVIRHRFCNGVWSFKFEDNLFGYL